MVVVSGTTLATVFVVLAAGLGLWTAIEFNRLVRVRYLVREGWSGVDVQLKRRQDLVPNIVETVKGYAGHERALLEKVTELRAGPPPDAEDLGPTQDRENALTDQLKRLFALAEAYPEIKADSSYLRLQGLLEEIEDQIQMARRYYNGAVREYNIRAESFPGNLVARLTGFRPAEFFQIETATARSAPMVEM